MHDDGYDTQHLNNAHGKPVQQIVMGCSESHVKPYVRSHTNHKPRSSIRSCSYLHSIQIVVEKISLHINAIPSGRSIIHHMTTESASHKTNQSLISYILGKLHTFVRYHMSYESIMYRTEGHKSFHFCGMYQLDNLGNWRSESMTGLIFIRRMDDSS